MNRKRLIIICTAILVLLFTITGVFVYVNLRNKPVSDVADRFVQALVSSPSDSLYTDSYSAHLKNEALNSAIDTQGFASAYSNYTTVVKYTGASDIVVSGNSATCEATATETTTDSQTGDKTVSTQVYKLTLKKVGTEWKIDGAELLSSVTK